MKQIKVSSATDDLMDFVVVNKFQTQVCAIPCQ